MTGHRFAPIGHSEVRINGLRFFLERDRSGAIFETVHVQDAPDKRKLRLLRAGAWKINFAK